MDPFYTIETKWFTLTDLGGINPKDVENLTDIYENARAEQTFALLNPEE